MKNKDTVQPTFLFHDYETFGQHPALDRPSQFAAIRTDSEFNIIDPPEVIYCRPADDYLPQPEAVLITGITPQQALAKGLNEAEFTARIHQLFSTPQTCVLGYNNLRFDDEVSRNLFYRNFYDPYAWSWQHNNSRWDLIDVIRACHALRPDGISWPENDKGLSSFRLEHLTKANGLSHDNAHDAMSDVYATIAMAKLVRQQQPKLFSYLLNHRHKRKIQSLINIAQMTPLVHVSGMFGAIRNNTSLIVPLAWHPHNQNAVISLDLAADPSPMLQLNATELADALFSPKDRGLPIVPLKLVHINKCPVLAPLNTLRAEDAQRLDIDQSQCIAHLELVRKHPQIREKALQIFADQQPFPATNDVDGRLYDGFFNDADKHAINIIRGTDPRHLAALDLKFSDNRIEPLLFRFRARNYPSTLDEQEQLQWLEHRRQQLDAQRVSDYFNQLQQLAVLHHDDSNKIRLLQALDQYARQLLS